jgi:hypothetical protein
MSLLTRYDRSPILTKPKRSERNAHSCLRALETTPWAGHSSSLALRSRRLLRVLPSAPAQPLLLHKFCKCDPIEHADSLPSDYLHFSPIQPRLGPSRRHQCHPQISHRLTHCRELHRGRALTRGNLQDRRPRQGEQALQHPRCYQRSSVAYQHLRNSRGERAPRVPQGHYF